MLLFVLGLGFFVGVFFGGGGGGFKCMSILMLSQYVKEQHKPTLTYTVCTICLFGMFIILDSCVFMNESYFPMV